jgi:phosphoglycerate kinase
MIISSINNNLKKIKGKKVLLRLDLNVPMKGARITNDYKLQQALPTIKLLQKLNCSIIIVTHLGEPIIIKNTKLLKSWSVKPLVFWLSNKLKTKIDLLPVVWPIIIKKIRNIKPRQIMMLENIRLFDGEITNSDVLAKRLATLGEVYVNDAFAVCHRQQASVSAIKKYLPAFAGLNLATEVTNLEKVRSGKKPFILIMGGAKLSTKLSLLKNLAAKATVVLVGGGIANTILKSKKINIGKSLYDEIGFKDFSHLNLKNIILPCDVGVLKNNRRVNKSLTELTNKDIILDIGPKTVVLFSAYLKGAKTIFWNGPMGVFEKPSFSFGTRKLAASVVLATSQGAFSLIGGGETIEALNSDKKKFSWVSTGGGAALTYFEGKTLPGLTKIIKY